MSAYLMIWSPKRFQWKDYSDDVKKFHNKGKLTLKWSCGNRKILPIGSRVFLMRVGVEPKGIVASGHTICAPYEVRGERAMYVDFRVDSLSNYPILTLEELAKKVSRKYNWTPEGSGIEIPTDIANKLAQQWRKRSLPDTASYQRAIQRVADRLNTTQKEILAAHYKAPGYTATARQLAEIVGLKEYRAVNLRYGLAAKQIRKTLHYRGECQGLSVLTSFHKPTVGTDREWRLIMRPQVASALERLGWISNAQDRTARANHPTKKAVIHVLIGNKDKDVSAIQHAGAKGEDVDWVVPKEAKNGQRVVFFVRPTGFLAEGVLLSDPAKPVRSTSKYRAGIGKIKLYSQPIPLAYIQQKLPEWAWTTYPRGYTTLLNKTADALNTILKSYNGKQVKQDQSTATAIEGVRREVVGMLQERNRGLRQVALKSANGVCAACGTDFSQLLGGLGIRVLQVHHRKQLSALSKPKANTVKDLAVVCANCHMLIHSDIKKAIRVEKLVEMLRRTR